MRRGAGEGMRGAGGGMGMQVGDAGGDEECRWGMRGAGGE